MLGTSIVIIIIIIFYHEASISFSHQHLTSPQPVSVNLFVLDLTRIRSSFTLFSNLFSSWAISSILFKNSFLASQYFLGRFTRILACIYILSSLQVLEEDVMITIILTLHLLFAMHCSELFICVNS